MDKTIFTSKSYKNSFSKKKKKNPIKKIKTKMFTNDFVTTLLT